MKRYPWCHFPPVWIHSRVVEVKNHPDYTAAKSGDSDAAYLLVNELASLAVGHALKSAFPERPTLVSAHAIERNGVNAIPEALAEFLAEQLDWPVDHGVVQSNIVGHTGADGFTRLARQAEFAGAIEAGSSYFLVDDFVGQGGTLANLRGFIMGRGGEVCGATVLTGKPGSAILSSEPSLHDELRCKHGDELEIWWKSRFGFDYECLTHSEVNYLLRTPTSERVRDRIAAAVED